ncbi:MAG: CAP domain-containing protein [Acidimicrobiales bacterium]
MTPRQRSIVLGAAAVVLTVTGLVVGARAVADARSADDAAAQYIETPGPEPAELAEYSAAQRGDWRGWSERDLRSWWRRCRTRFVVQRAATPTTTAPIRAETPTTGVLPTPSTVTTLRPTIPTPTIAVTTATTAPGASASTSSTTAVETTATTPTTVTEPTSAPTLTTAPTVSTAPTTATPVTTAPTTAPTTVPTPSGLTAVEREIVRLTNELRANPSGPLARRKPMASCVSQSFYGITIDPATGHPRPVPALIVNEVVSIDLARAWSIEMDRTGNFAHRPNAQAAAVFDRLGLPVSATGENIAWFSGYADAEAAQVHFEGWRESDTGHYCALVAGTFTHIGVGHHNKGATRSWATQNFYRLR